MCRPSYYTKKIFKKIKLHYGVKIWVRWRKMVIVIGSLPKSNHLEITID